MERKVEQSESLAQIKDITAGCLAGAIGKFIEYPFDTLKVLCQINTNNINQQSTYAITKHVLQNEGLFRIYRGLSAPMIGSCLENLIVFWLFGSTERFFKSKYTDNAPLSLWQISICAAIAGTGNVLQICPVEFIKCQMQAPNTALMYQHSTLKCFIYNISHNPLHLFNKNAMIATGCREIPGSIIWFDSYKITTRTLTKYFVNDMDDENDAQVPMWIYLSGGAMAGLSYWTICYPFDLIKSLIQTEEVDMTQIGGKKTKKSASFWRQLYGRYRQYGFRSLYNGFSVTIPRAIISNAAIFVSYEYCRNYLDQIALRTNRATSDIQI